MAQQLIANNYTAINDDINILLTSGAYSGISVSVYTDAEQINLATDSNGPILTRTISQITHVASHTDNNGQIVPASIILGFSDDTTVTAVDGVDNLWYVMSGIVFKPRTFGSA